VLGVEVFMVSTSTWVISCSSDSPRLLVPVVAGWGSVDACGWVVVSRT
jgi:hypothetical protein